MGNKANIQKLKEGALLGNGSNKPIYPHTIDKAVNTKWLGSYLPLDKVLSNKCSNVLSYTTFSLADTDNNEEEIRKFYHLFSFSDPNKRQTFNTILHLGHRDFKKYIQENGDDNDVDYLSLYDNLSLNSEECLQQRLMYRCVTKLYIDAINLHTGSDFNFVLKDEEGNLYNNGDTIYFNSYPGKLYLLLNDTNQNNSHFQELRDIVTNMDTDIPHELYILSESGEQPNVDYVTMNTKWHQAMSGYSDYQDPNRLSTSASGEQLNISSLNVMLDLMINGSALMYILPSDYPVEDVNESILSEYEQQTKVGIIRISEVLNRNGEPMSLNNGIMPCVFTAVFNAQNNFMFITEQTSVTLTKAKGWKNSVMIKGTNAAENSIVEVSILPSGSNLFKIGLDDQEEENYSDSLTINGSDLEEGVNINIIPSTFTSNLNGKLPFDGTAGTTSATLSCKYIDSNSEVSTFSNILINSITAEADAMSFVNMEVTPVANVPTASEGIACVALTLSNNIEPITISNTYIKFTKIVGNAASLSDILIQNVSYKYHLKETLDEEMSFSNLDISSWESGNIPMIFSEEMLANRGLMLAVKIPSVYNTYPVTMGKVCIEGTTRSGKSLKLIVPFDFTDTQSSSFNRELYGRVIDWKEKNGEGTALLATDNGISTVINVLTNGVSTVLDSDAVKVVNKLGDEAFANIATLTSGNFLGVLTEITEIPDHCFLNDVNMTNVIIPEGVTSIGYAAFCGTGLTEVTIPDSVTNIENMAFSECHNLETVDIGSGITKLVDGVFYNSENITDVYLRSETPVNIDTLQVLHHQSQMFAAGSEVTLHVPAVEIEGMTIKEAYENENSPWMNIPNVTVTVVEIVVQ